MDGWENKEVNRLVRKMLRSYAAKGVYFDVKKRIKYLPNNRLRLDIKVLPETRISDIKRHANDVRLSLKLAVLEVVQEPTLVYIIISKEVSLDEHRLLKILATPEFTEAKRSMGLALPVGVDDLGHLVIKDLTNPKCPHIIVSGTSGSGKTVALKSMLTTIISSYPPQKVNLLIGDKANDLSQFADLKHLSYPLIGDFDTFLSVLLLLKEEMDRRISMKTTAEFNQFPIIVCVIDEFNSFMAEAMDKEKSDLAVDMLTQILRMGRHARIHFILAAHNPTKVNMGINTSDLPVKMAFQVSNLHNSITALGVGGAEKLKGDGDMLFKINGEIQHLQGAFIPPDEIDYITNQVRQSESKIAMSPKQYRSQNRSFPRGIKGFTISDADMERMEDVIQGRQIVLPYGTNSQGEARSNTERLLAKIIAWTLNQEEISCNQISENFGVGWRRANNFIKRLYELGIVGELDAKLPRKVLVQSVENIPAEALSIMQSNGIPMESIMATINHIS